MNKGLGFFLFLMGTIVLHGSNTEALPEKRWGIPSASRFYNPAVIIPSGMTLAAVVLCLHKYLIWYTARSVKNTDNPFYILKEDTSSKTVTVYFHGWGETAQRNPLRSLLETVPGTVISFDFVDAQSFGDIIRLVAYPDSFSSAIKGLFANIKPHKFLLGMAKSNFAQLPDVLRALKVLKHVKEQGGIEKINLFGRSRGGAVVVNLLAVLNDKSKQYDQALESIGITVQERKELLDLLQRGKHVMSVALMDPDYAFPVSKWLMGLCTQYNPWGLKMKEQVDNLKGLSLDTIIHYQRHDSIVGNHHDERFYQVMKQYNPETTQLLYDELDHNDWIPNLQTALQKWEGYYEK